MILKWVVPDGAAIILAGINGSMSTVISPATRSIAPTNGATHFRIINALSVVSDTIYNSLTRSFEPAEPVLNETSNVAYYDYTPVDVVTSLIDVTATLPGAQT